MADDAGASGGNPIDASFDALAGLFTHVDEAVVCCDELAIIRFASPGIRSLLGYDPRSVVGRSLAEFIHPDELEQALEGFIRWNGRSGTPRGQAQRILAADGSWRALHYDAVTGPQVEPFGAVIVTLRPADQVDPEHRELLQRLLNEDRLVRLASAFLHVGVDEFERGLEQAMEELAGLEWVTRVSVWVRDGDRLHRRAVWEAPVDAPAIAHGERLRIDQFELTRRLAALMEVHLRSGALGEGWEAEQALLDAAGVKSVLAVPMATAGVFAGVVMLESTFEGPAFDATHVTTLRSAAAILAGAFVRHQAEQRLAEQARIDAVTGLGSRWAFNAALDRALQAVAAGASPGFGLAIVDLDRFKLVNDALGHTAGDRLLADVAVRLQSVAGEHTTLARLGGDELLVLHEQEADLAGALERTTELIDALRPPFDVGGRPVSLTASVGLVHASDTSADGGELLRRADLAMYRAKDRGGDQLEVDDEHLRERVASRLHRESELRAAVEGDGLVVHFQAEWELDTGRLLGAEALARWDHPEDGLLLAGDFIPLAEECGIIDDLGIRVLREACRTVAAWRADGHALDFTLRVNLAARQLRSSDLHDQVADALADTGLPPSALCLELTESSLLLDPERSVAVLEKLRELGVGLAVDDFGTGYSSMLYLKRLPLTALKIDRAFVTGLADDPSDRAIVRSTVQLADALGISVTAEGVETDAQRVALLELGCRRAQGFLLAEPEPAHTFVHRLNGHRPAVAPR